jgi:exosome complex exonuclease DIS3/RRP44
VTTNDAIVGIIADTSAPHQRLGLEGLVTFSKDSHAYDAEQYQLTVPAPKGEKVDISVFDTVVVDISLEKDKQTQRSKVKMTMVSPANSEDL